MNELSEKAFDLINEFKARCIDACCDADSWYERDKAQVALRDYIAELEGKIDQLTAHSDIERQDDKSPNDTQTQTIVYGKESEE